MSTQFSDRIRSIMQEHKLSAKDFAERLNVQRSSISHLISGRNKPSVDFIVKLTNAFPEINPHWLLHGKGNPSVTSVTDGEITNVSNAQTPESTGGSDENKDDTTVTDRKVKEVPNPQMKSKESEKTEARKPSISLENVQLKGEDSKQIKQIILVYTDGSFEVLKK